MLPALLDSVRLSKKSLTIDGGRGLSKPSFGTAPEFSKGTCYLKVYDNRKIFIRTEVVG